MNVRVRFAIKEEESEINGVYLRNDAGQNRILVFSLVSVGKFHIKLTLTILFLEK